MGDESQKKLADQLMNAVGFTAEELESNRKGTISTAQMERIKRQLQMVQTNGRAWNRTLAAFILGSVLVAFLIAIPALLQSAMQDAATAQGVSWVNHLLGITPSPPPPDEDPLRPYIPALAVGGMAVVIIAGGLSNKNRWQDLQAEVAREKVSVKTLAGRVKPLEEPSEAKLFNRYVPEAVRITRKPWLYFARVGNKTHLLDHDPARAYAASVEYLIYYVGGTSAPLVLSAEPKKGRP